MKLIGLRAGGLGSFTFTQAGLFFRTDVRLSYGGLKYQSEGSGTKDRVPDAIFEPRFVVGKDFPSDNGMVFSPYAGLGFRTLYNDLRGNTTGRSTPANPSGLYAGYRRYSYYLYAPVGLSTRVGLDDRWVLAPIVEYDFFLRGTQISTLSDVGGCNRDITNTQKRGYGYRAAFMVEKSRWAFGPWMHRWSIEDSDLQPDACGGRPLLEPRKLDAGDRLRDQIPVLRSPKGAQSAPHSPPRTFSAQNRPDTVFESVIFPSRTQVSAVASGKVKTSRNSSSSSFEPSCLRPLAR